MSAKDYHIIKDLKGEIESFSDFANLLSPQREVEFIAYYFANWQKERLINKACEWLRKDMEEGVIPYFDEGLVASSTADTLDDFINAFKKHLEDEK